MVVVEHKPGSQGMIGGALVKFALSDGYTLLLPMSSSVACVNPALHKSMSFDVMKEFAPIGFIGAAPLVRLVSRSLPLSRVDQFIAYVKADPGKVNHSSSGVGGSAHLYGSVMNATSGLDMQLLPNQGGMPAMQTEMAVHCSGSRSAKIVLDLYFVDPEGGVVLTASR